MMMILCLHVFNSILKYVIHVHCRSVRDSPWLLDEGWEGETVHGYWMKAGEGETVHGYLMKGRCKLTLPPHSTETKVTLY